MNDYLQSLTEARGLVGENELEGALLIIGEVLNKASRIGKYESLRTNFASVKGQFYSFKKLCTEEEIKQKEKEKKENRIRGLILDMIRDVENKIRKEYRKKKRLWWLFLFGVSITLLLFLFYRWYTHSGLKNTAAIKCLNESELIVYIERMNQVDTIDLTEDLMKIVDCEFRDNECYSLRFNLMNEEYSDVTGLKIDIKQLFIGSQSNIWGLIVDGWGKSYENADVNRTVYYPNTFIKDKVVFIVGCK